MGLRLTLYDADGPARSFSGFLGREASSNGEAISRNFFTPEMTPCLKPEIYRLYIIVSKAYQFFGYRFLKISGVLISLVVLGKADFLVILFQSFPSHQRFK